MHQLTSSYQDQKIRFQFYNHFSRNMHIKSIQKVPKQLCNISVDFVLLCTLKSDFTSQTDIFFFQDLIVNVIPVGSPKIFLCGKLSLSMNHWLMVVLFSSAKNLSFLLSPRKSSLDSSSRISILKQPQKSSVGS